MRPYRIGMSSDTLVRGLPLEHLDGVGASGGRRELRVPPARRRRAGALPRRRAILGRAVRRRRQLGALDLGHGVSLHEPVTSSITQIG